MFKYIFIGIIYYYYLKRSIISAAIYTNIYFVKRKEYICKAIRRCNSGKKPFKRRLEKLSFSKIYRYVFINLINTVFYLKQKAGL